MNNLPDLFLNREALLVSGAAKINREDTFYDNFTHNSDSSFQIKKSESNVQNKRNLPPNRAQNHPQKRKKTKEKKSAGVACLRKRDNKYQILLVSRRYTYAFDEFMHGNYNTHNNNEILKLLDGMTVDEKLILLSLDFLIVWYFWWMNNEYNSQAYFHMRNKYMSIINDNGKRLRALINKSKNGSRIWEIPKGRRNRGESEIECAIRETKEETGLNKQDYKLLHLPPIKQSYVDTDITYTTNYFIAECLNDSNIRIQYDIETIGEISEIKWMSIEEIRIIDQFNRLANLCTNIITKYRNEKM